MMADIASVYQSTWVFCCGAAGFHASVLHHARYIDRYRIKLSVL